MAFVESNLNRFNSASNAMAQTEDAIQRRKQLNAERTANLNENIMEAGGNIADILSKRKENETQRRFEGDEAAADRYTNYDLERLRYEHNLAVQNAADRAAQQRLQFGDDSNISNLSDLFWTAYPGAAQAMGVWDMAAGDTTEEFDWSDSAAVASMKLKFMSLIANQSDEDKKALEAFFDSMVADRAAGREPEVPEKPSDRGGGRFGITLNTNLGLSSGRATGAGRRGNTSGTTGRAAGYMNSIPEPTSQPYSYGETGVYVPTEQTQPAPVPEKKRGFWQRVSEAFR